MKTKVASLLVVLVFTATQIMAQNKITVEAQNNDISNNLDLKAVATAFGESQNLEEFEQKLNDYDSGISNLDLNNDGQVDYLRVIEKNENDVHVVVIQAVLDKDVYQDVASIIVEKDQNNNPTVQVIGDPYLYGDNYIIEPAYAYTPSIFSFFWGPNYYNWYSPYYWGYYPNYYHHRRPFELNVYMSNVYSQIDHNQRYYYTNSIRNNRALILQRSIQRNDYGNRYPDRSFSNRNENIRNKRSFEFNRNGVIRNNQVRSTYQGSPSVNRSVRSFDNNGNYNAPGNRNYNTERNARVNRNQYNTNTQTYTSPTNNVRSNVNNNIQRNNTYQPRPNTDNGNRNNNSLMRENTRSNTQVTQPKPAVQRSNENVRSREVKSENRSESRSSNKESDRR